jgi:endogenous inhibitor of DNA gyrase (YacG/DUF329 family)
VSRGGTKENPPQTQRKCPICGKPATKEHEPFCSKRCAQIDLHRWLSGTYVIPGAKGSETPDREDDD